MKEETITKIVVVDDHNIFRKGLCLLLESKPGLRVTGDCASAEDALKLVNGNRPDVVLLDLNLDGSDGIGSIADLAKLARVIILTGEKDTRLHQKCLKLGASGLVLKEKASEVLFHAIERVHDGELWFKRRILEKTLIELTRPEHTPEEDIEQEKIDSLTGREKEVIDLISEGLKNKEIAQRLFISETTVRHHLTSIFSKLGLNSRLELVIYAFKYELAQVPEVG